MRGIPRVQNALVATEPGVLALKRVPVPTIQPDEVLVKTAAVALNPSDHKLLDQSTTIGAISGSDFAGTVVQVGDDVHNLKEGDRIFGAVFGANPGYPSNGAFGSYTAATADLCLRMPTGMSFATASSLGMGIMTCGLIFRALGLECSTGEQATSLNDKPYILVHGGATATGTVLTQLLAYAGYQPLITCSPSNFALTKSRGAVATFDYNNPECKDQIRAYTQDRLTYAVDCIGNAATMTLCYSALGSSGGQYVTVEHFPRRLTIRRRDVTAQWVLGWTLFGKEVKLAGAYAREACPADVRYGKEWMDKVQPVLHAEKGKGLESHPLDVVGRRGLVGVLPKLEALRRGEIKGKKVIVLL